MKLFFAAAVLLGALSLWPVAAASPPACSIRPPAGLAEARLPALAKVSAAQARRTLDALYAGRNVRVESSELEAEDHCLIYSYDVRMPGVAGIEEVAIDAGNGKVLSRSHESPAQEHAEQRADKAAAVKPAHSR